MARKIKFTVTVTPEQMKSDLLLCAIENEEGDIAEIGLFETEPADNVYYTKSLKKFSALELAGCFAAGERTLTLGFDEDANFVSWS